VSVFRRPALVNELCLADAWLESSSLAEIAVTSTEYSAQIMTTCPRGYRGYDDALRDEEARKSK